MICHPVAISIVFCFLFFAFLNKQNYLKLDIKYQVAASIVLGLVISGLAAKLYSGLTSDSGHSFHTNTPPAPLVGGINPEVPANITDKDDHLRDGQNVEDVGVVTHEAPVEDNSIGGYYLLNHSQFSSQGLSLDGVKKIGIGEKFSEILN